MARNDLGLSSQPISGRLQWLIMLTNTSKSLKPVSTSATQPLELSTITHCLAHLGGRRPMQEHNDMVLHSQDPYLVLVYLSPLKGKAPKTR